MNNIIEQFKKIDMELADQELKQQLDRGFSAPIQMAHNEDIEIIRALLVNPSLLLKFYHMDNKDIERLRKKVKIAVKSCINNKTEDGQSYRFPLEEEEKVSNLKI